MNPRSIRAIKVILVYGLLGSAVALPAYATETDSEIHIFPFWEKGDKIDYQIIKKRRRVENGQITHDGGSSTNLTVEVIASTDVGYEISWTMGKTILDDPKLAQNPIVRQMSELMNGFSLLLKVDEVATLQGATNWQDLKSIGLELLKPCIEELHRGGMPQNQTDLVKQQLEDMFATKEKIEQLCLKEPLMFFLPLGRSYSLTNRIEYQDKLPNPFGGEPFPAVGFFSLRNHDDKKNIAKVIWQQTFDAEAAKKILDESFKRMATKLGKSTDKLDLPKIYSIEDKAEYSIDTSSGWILYMKHSRITNMGNGSQEDTLIIKRRNGEDSPKRS